VYHGVEMFFVDFGSNYVKHTEEYIYTLQPPATRFLKEPPIEDEVFEGLEIKLKRRVKTMNRA
jgi:hypothetical protein